MKEIKKLDFNGQIIFSGIDVHLSSWKVCEIFNGMELKTYSQSPCAQTLANHLKRTYPGAIYKCVYEAGFCGFHVQRTLQANGVDCIVVNPADVPVKDKEKRRKCDVVDCRKLARCLSKNELDPIFIPSLQQQDDRCLIRCYFQFGKDCTRVKNRIKSSLNCHGVTIVMEDNSKCWTRRYIQKLKAVTMPGPLSRKSLDFLITNLEQIRSQILIITRELKSLANESRYEEKKKNITSVPGIGLITGMLYLLEIADIKRFRTLDNLADFVGLVPQTASSGPNEIVFDMTHRGHPKMRESLIEASWVAVRKDPALLVAYTAYCKRMPKNKAIIKIARKLLNRIRYVLKNDKEYVSSTVE